MDEIGKLKIQYLKKIIIAFSAIFLIFFIGFSLFDHSNERTLQKADITKLSSEMIKGYTPTGCLSECFYSTNKDLSVRNDFKVYKSYRSFEKWYKKHHNIVQTFPKNWNEISAKEKFKNGYYAVVVSSSKLQDPYTQVLAEAKYKDKENNVIISLSATGRNSGYKYNKNPEKYCKQIYTVVYINKEELKEMKSIKFAFNIKNK